MRFADVHDRRVTATTTSQAIGYVFQPAAAVKSPHVCYEICRRDRPEPAAHTVGQGYAISRAGPARELCADGA